MWWSSGKDSAWALHQLRSKSGVEVERLVTTVTPRFDRVAIHGTRIDILQAQADSVGVPLEMVELPFPCSNDDYLAAIEPLIQRAERESVDQMAFGDLFLEDVRDYRQAIFAQSSIEAWFPIWGRNTHALATEIIESGVEAYITCLDPKRISSDLVGVRYDVDFLGRLPGGVDPCGENGEFHTCVVDGPMMQDRLELTRGDIVERGGFVYADFVQTERSAQT